MKFRFKARFPFLKVALTMIILGILIMVVIPYLITVVTKLIHTLQENTGAVITPTKKSLLKDTWAFLVGIITSYFIINNYYNLIVKRKKLLSFLKVSFIIFVCAFAYNSILYYCWPQAMLNSYNSLTTMAINLSKTLVPMFVIGFLFVYGTYLWEALQQKRVLEEQKLQLETQISQANFKFLKAQINPHFLHNTLNFLYSKSIPYSAELSEGILTLSDIMRYALDQGNQQDGKAPLKDEIEHVKNVILINQLRYSNELKVNFEVTGDAGSLAIIPFVLITLVENAFKHGDLKNPDFPITIKLNLENNSLYFYCRNKKKAGPKQLSTGIGMENIKTRLEYAYGEKHKFTVQDETDFYITELTIDEL
jgi:two-component system, LytTR family, sensor kinase